MQKRYFLKFTLALLYALPPLLCACSDEDGDDLAQENAANALQFSGERTRQTRADDAMRLSDLVGDLRLFGLKIVEGKEQPVIENYVLWWNGAAGSTSTNAQGWEYVGNRATNQSIKYWDYSATKYLFFGVAKAEQCNAFTLDAVQKSLTATININENQLTSDETIPYFTQPVKVEKSSYQNTVTLPFSRLLSRVRVGFYETIPGYAVKEVKFYIDDTSATQEDCCLWTDYAQQSTITMTYDLDATHDYSSPALTMDIIPVKTDNGAKRDFGSLNYTRANDNLLTGDLDSESFLGKFSSGATYAGVGDGYYTNFVPYPDRTAPLSLKVDYTLLANDGSGHQMVVRGANAIVPAAYCRWQPNYSYTYLFKISDNTNGSTGGDVTGLVPITFVAYSEEAGTDNNHLGTITTVGEYSITTYQEGSVVGDDDTTGSVVEDGIDYITNKEIEVTVVKHTEDKHAPNYITLTHTGMPGGAATDPLADLPADNAEGDYVIIYHQKTTKEWRVEDDTTDSLTPTTGVYRETIERVITDTSSPDYGKALFIPDVTGTYRIEYWHKDAGSDTPQQLAVKIVKIKGEGSNLELYDKWQSGSSSTTGW